MSRKRNFRSWTPETSRLAHAAKRRKAMANPVDYPAQIPVGMVLHRLRIESAVKGCSTQIEIVQAQRRNQLNDGMIDNTASTLGSMAQLARLYGRKGFAAYKALAISQAVVSTAGGAARALGDLPYPYSLVAMISVLASGAAQIATIAAEQPPGYVKGGYTGDGPRYAVAGQVHRGEFVMPAPAVDRIGVSALESLAAGGNVGGGNSRQLNIAFVRSYQEAREWLDTSAGERQIMDMVMKNRHQLRM